MRRLLTEPASEKMIEAWNYITPKPEDAHRDDAWGNADWSAMAAARLEELG